MTPAGAALATLLGLKPVLQIQGGKLDAYAKVRGMANAEKTMLKALKKTCKRVLRACCAHCGGVLRRHQARARVAQDNTQVF